MKMEERMRRRSGLRTLIFLFMTYYLIGKSCILCALFPKLKDLQTTSVISRNIDVILKSRNNKNNQEHLDKTSWINNHFVNHPSRSKRTLIVFIGGAPVSRNFTAKWPTFRRCCCRRKKSTTTSKPKSTTKPPTETPGPTSGGTTAATTTTGAPTTTSAPDTTTMETSTPPQTEASTPSAETEQLPMSSAKGSSKPSTKANGGGTTPSGTGMSTGSTAGLGPETTTEIEDFGFPRRRLIRPQRKRQRSPAGLVRRSHQAGTGKERSETYVRRSSRNDNLNLCEHPSKSPSTRALQRLSSNRRVMPSASPSKVISSRKSYSEGRVKTVTTSSMFQEERRGNHKSGCACIRGRIYCSTT